MRDSTKILTALLLFLCSLNYVSAQEVNPISEDDVPLKILGYFYSSYKHAAEAEWSTVDEIGEKLLRVSFVADDTDKAVLYDPNGELIEEVSFIAKNKSEYLIKSKISKKYPDSKLLTIKKVTRYDLAGMKKQPKSYFEVSAKNGKDIVYVFFDEDKQLLKPDNVFNLAIN
ncbi:MAG: hypothetical protein WBA74_16075 [Cyclobacteriaceae bacterium]